MLPNGLRGLNANLFREAEKQLPFEAALFVFFGEQFLLAVYNSDGF